MPGRDGTGPAGLGPMTGRATGYCTGIGVASPWNPAWGRGFPGWGRGWRNRFYATGLTGLATGSRRWMIHRSGGTGHDQRTGTGYAEGPGGLLQGRPGRHPPTNRRAGIQNRARLILAPIVCLEWDAGTIALRSGRSPSGVL